MRPFHPATFGLLLALVCSVAPAGAETALRTNGSDTYVTGTADLPDLDAKGDVFAAGSSVVLRGRAAGDLHVMGFDAMVELPAGQDLYAMGANVDLRAPVAGDLTAMGFSVRTAPEAATRGNARLMAASLTIEGGVDGALTASGSSLRLNAPIGGDAWLSGETISFGPAAKIGGQLIYSAPAPLTIPPEVIAPDRVRFELLPSDDMMGDWDNGWRGGHWRAMPGYGALASGFLVTLGFLVLVGALALGFAPKLVERMRVSIAAGPGVSLLSGVIGLSMLFGLVPISAMTIIGLPLVPIVLLAIVLAWTTGYVLGAYAAALWLLRAAGGPEDPGTVLRLFALAVGVFLVALLNFVPFLGWLINFALVLLGIGAMTRQVFDRILRVPVEPAAPDTPIGP